MVSLIPSHRWEGKAVEEVGKDKATGTIRVRIDPKFYRPTEVVRFYQILFRLRKGILCHKNAQQLSDNSISFKRYIIFKSLILCCISFCINSYNMTIGFTICDRP